MTEPTIQKIIYALGGNDELASSWIEITTNLKTGEILLIERGNNDSTTKETIQMNESIIGSSQIAPLNTASNLTRK